MGKEQFFEQNNGCSGYCFGCKRFEEEAPTLRPEDSEVGVPTSPKESVGKEIEKGRSKESEDEEKLDKLVKEMKKREKQKKEEYKKKKYK